MNAVAEKTNGILKTKIILPYGIKKPKSIDTTQCFTIRVTATPEMCQRWLSTSKTNRPLNIGNLRFLMSQMSSGKWVFNGESMTFDKHGRMIEGQHRAEASVRTGVSIDTNITIGVDESVYSTINTGKVKSASDVLAVNGFSNYNAMSAAANFIIKFRKGLYYNRQSKRILKIDNNDILNFCQKEPDFETRVSDGLKLYFQSNKLIRSTEIIAFSILFREKDPILCNSFIERMVLGTDIKKGSNLMKLRNRLMRAKLNPELRIKPKARLMMIINAWNAEREGKTLKTLQVKKTDQFPKIK